MSRADLLALTPDALAALANRGLVKRAAKDLDAGNGPEVTVAADGGVHGAYADGTRTALPAGAGLEAATCTCAAPSACRHRICLVLAYQRDHAAEPAPEAAGAEIWSPGEFDDDALARVLGQRAITAARRTFRAGYAARVHRPGADDPVARVELPSCTVRFLVPKELGYVDTDAVAAVRGEVTVLAVWAFRAADERAPGDADVRVDVGGRAGAAAEGAGGTGLEGVLDLAGQVLLEGAAHAGPVLSTGLRRAAAELAARDLHWPSAAVDELAGQLDAHRERRADHEPGRLAALLAEVHARHRAALNGAPRTQVLGTDESAETPLRRVRLAALGCRVGGTADTRTAAVYLAHADTVLVLKRRWAVPDGEQVTGADLAARKILGTSLRGLATANVVSETATRSAGRVVRVAPGRVAKTTVTPLGDAWDGLPPALLVRDLAAEGRALDALPPRLVRPRVEAELVRVVAVAEVRDVGYHPGDQRLDAVVADGAGTTAVVSADYAPHRPGALDALAGALAAGPRFVSGALRRDRGGLVIDPFAVMTGDGVVVPDLAPGDGSAALDGPSARPPDPLGAVLDAALAVCAEAAQRGLLHVPRGFRDRLDRAGKDLDRIGLRAAAASVAGLAAALDGGDPHRMTRTWADAHIRLITTAELR
ncbi:hypothetical protein [Actinomadura rubrisoli]|uniref:SWIM-type domain-containing protein n=1 Tax=Actinomadura rubrisoli TaxID=2530368 RepID=A0A4R5C9A9_9ACTN|nr:hypothetical protein [Actinomadura rubrisoli]TDD94780.1 hypothetical protein E1298_06325 [Actinomadura rubrisoli]